MTISGDTQRPAADVQAAGQLSGSHGALLTPVAVLEGLPDAVVAVDPDERLVFVNGLAEQLFGHTRSEMVGQPVRTLWPERYRSAYTRNMRLLFETEGPLRFTTDVWGLRRDGSEFVGEMSWGVMQTTGGPLLLAVGRDLTQRLAAEARALAVARLGELALSGVAAEILATEAVSLMREHLPVTGARVRIGGEKLLATTGTTAGRAHSHPLTAGATLTVHTQRRLSDDERAMVRGVIGVLGSALTRLAGEEQARHDAVHDPLTGLANRTLLGDRLAHAVAKSHRGRTETAVMFIDVDHFKRINDSYGHPTGDAVLAEVARRLLAAVRPEDTVARFGGDEFVAICEGVEPAGALTVARRILDAVRQPMGHDGAHHQLSASIGVAIGAEDGSHLLAEADAAAYRAKANGRDRIELA